MSWRTEYLQSLFEELSNETQENRSRACVEIPINDPTFIFSELLGCGRQLFDALFSALQTLSNDPESHSPCQVLQGLLDTAYEKMSQGSAGSCWPRLYTDVSIIRSLASLNDRTSRAAIATLDQAIIVAGAVGLGRIELVLTLIRKIQTEFLTFDEFKPSQIDNVATSPIPGLQTSSHVIQAIDPAPSFITFQQKSNRHPFVLRQYARSWPAINEHPWCSAAYLRSVSGPARIVPVEVGVDYRTDDWTQQFMGWEEFLSSLALVDQLPTSTNQTLYLAQHNLFMQFPDLNRDVIIPDYVYSCPPPPEDYPQYKPPGNDQQLVINSWLGPGETISPAHTDPYFNLYVQVVGRKTIWLAPPSVNPFMYPFGDGAEDLQSQEYDPRNPASNKTSPSMSNTSRVDVFTLDWDESRRRFPIFWLKVVPQAMSATLGPGDMLSIPPGWWHAMRAEETSFSVSMWF